MEILESAAWVALGFTTTLLALEVGYHEIMSKTSWKMAEQKVGPRKSVYYRPGKMKEVSA